MSNKYNKISKEALLNHMQRGKEQCGYDHFGIKDTAEEMKTSRYQVAKYMHKLQDEGVVKFVRLGGGMYSGGGGYPEEDVYCDFAPPVQAYEFLGIGTEKDRKLRDELIALAG